MLWEQSLVGSSPTFGTMDYQSENTAYIIGVAIGDGNLSNPNGRATRLRITCDNKYPKLQTKITASLRILFPNNKVSKYLRKENCTDISIYSNRLEGILGWKASGGSKFRQDVSVPTWLMGNEKYIKNCLLGLFETDGSLYKDRNYTYANFTTIIHRLAMDVDRMINKIGYKSNTQKILQKSGKYKYVIRVSKDSIKFIKDIGLSKK